ncbi:MAG: mannosyltransferase family protein [Gemmatimonadales bacterium]
MNLYLRGINRRTWELVLCWCVAMALVWGIAAARVGSGPAGPRQITDPVSALSTWDGEHYTAIATKGYSTEGPEARRFAFFPLLPALASALGARSHAQLAGVLLSQFLYLVALLLLSDLTKAYRSSESRWSDPAIWLLASPLSFFFAMFYTESLFLVCTLGAVWAANRGERSWSVCAAFLAGLTRPTAICLPFLFVGEAVTAARRGEGWRWYLLPALATLVGIATYFLWVAALTGQIDGYLGIQKRFWGSERTIPYVPLADRILSFLWEVRHLRLLPYHQLVQIGSALTVMIILAWGWRRLPVGWLAYAIASLLLAHSSLPFASTARYEVVLFPIFVLMPWTVLARPRIAPVVFCFFVLVQSFLLFKVASWQWVA